MQDENLLQIRDLSVSFSSNDVQTTALNGVSFGVKKGEVLAIVGESGSGKTVTSLATMRLLPDSARIDSGQMLFSDRGKTVDLLQLNEKEMTAIRGSRISMVFQEPMTSLNPLMTCGAQVAEALLHHEDISAGKARIRTIKLFERVRLPDPENIFIRYPHELSGGQKQRVMIAMAISCEPSLLIADEPTTALDVVVQKSIIELLGDLQRQMGMSIIYITHDLGLVREIADRILVMFRGDMVELNTTEIIFNHPSKKYTRALLDCRPKPSNKGKRLPMVSDFLPDEGNEISLSHDLKRPAEVKDPGQADSGVFISVKDLTVRFPVKKNFFGKVLREYAAVDNVSFEIKKGETLGLVGESGCGKTTLGRALLRLVEPNGGSIMMNGTNLLQEPAARMRSLRKDIQIVFQDPYGSLNPRMTVGEAIREPMGVHHIESNNRQRRERAVSLLERVGLKSEHYHRYPHEFSGGQRQRICIARALSLNPAFLVCDESVSALDVSVQAQVLNLLSDLKREFGFTAVFISHDLSVVYYISDRIMVMQHGRIVETGSAEQVYFHPRETYTQQLIAAIPGYDQ